MVWKQLDLRSSALNYGLDFLFYVTANLNVNGS